MPHFALIDAARDDSILPLIQQEKSYRCLFGGDLEPEVEKVAPYIVQLDRNSQFPNVLQTHGWVNNWGITCHASAPLMTVRRKLRQSLEAVLPTGEVALFRFYDPRVWVPFIMASKGSELDPWFDPIDSYWARHPKSGATLHFSRNGDAVNAVAV